MQEENLIDFKNTSMSISTQKIALTKQQKRERLATRLKIVLTSRNIANNTFANAIGKSPSEVSKWLSGKHNFTIDTLFDIESFLNVDLINIGPSIKPVIGGVKKFNKVNEISSRVTKPTEGIKLETSSYNQALVKYTKTKTFSI